MIPSLCARVRRRNSSRLRVRRLQRHHLVEPAPAPPNVNVRRGGTVCGEERRSAVHLLITHTLMPTGPNQFLSIKKIQFIKGYDYPFIYHFLLTKKN